MFVNNFLKRIALQPGGLYVGFTKKYASALAFGDPRMPDKLYKNVILEIKSYERAVMKSYEKFISMAAQNLEISVDQIVSKRKPDYERYDLLKSIFVHRKHLVQYEIRTHYTWIHLKNLTGSTADTFLEYVERMLPEGVGLKVTKVSLEPLPTHLNPKSIQEISDNNS